VVTGPIGAGKSLLTRRFAARGAVLIEGDALGHQVLGEPEVVAEIGRVFGPEVAPAGTVDRAGLGRLVFTDPDALARLNAITHPRLAARIRESFLAVEQAGQADLAVLEAAVFFLLPSVGPIDLTIAIVAGEAQRRARLVSAGRLSAAEADLRIAAQRSWHRFWQRADVLLANDGSVADLHLAAERLLAAYRGGED